ncbi:Protein lifeguard 4 [Schistosoma japonicum]|nr:Protein lifeguard 4 [Schistosoma japonicum]
MNSFLITQESGHPIEKDFAFNNNVANAHVTIRLRFLRKVYGILFTQLLLTSLCAGTMMMLKPILLENLQQKYVVILGAPVITVTFFPFSSVWLPIVLIFSTFGILLALMWKRRESPTNFVLLYLFVSLMLNYFHKRLLFSRLSANLYLWDMQRFVFNFKVITYSATVVLQAFILTTIVVMSLMMYTLNSKKDFSKWGVGLSVAFLILLLAGPINLFLGSSLLELCMATGGACLFSLFIIYDTWRIMHHCSPEEYIMACIDLYLDILNLFMYILRLLKELQHNQG